MTTGVAFTIQFRVIYALILREVHTLYGHTSLGYIWAIIQTAFSIGVFWVFRLAMRTKAPHGMTELAFLVCGFLIWNIFSQSLVKCMNAIDGNRALLTFPQVFPLDVMLSRSIVVLGTQVVSMSIILGIGAVFGYPVVVSHVGLLLLSLLLSLSFGLGCGTLIATLAVYAPALRNLVPMLLRLLFFASGIFFSVSMFSHRVGEWLLLNPIMQLIEMTRMSMANGYVSPYFDLQYLLMVNLCIVTLGLLLERFIRRRLQA